MSTPEVKLKLILEIDGVEKIIDSVDYTDTIQDLYKDTELNFNEDDIFDYVMEVRDKM
jgi:hypothetical protein